MDAVAFHAGEGDLHGLSHRGLQTLLRSFLLQTPLCGFLLRIRFAQTPPDSKKRRKRIAFPSYCFS